MAATHSASSADLILALDVGTSSTKAGLFDPLGTRLALVRHSYRNHVDTGGKYEQDPECWYRAVRKCLRETAVLCDPSRIRAIAITALRAAVIAVDSKGKSITAAPLAHDLRAAQEACSLAARLGIQAVYDATGLLPLDYFSLPRMLWLRRQRSEVLLHTARWLGTQDYILHQLCGEYVADPSQAGRTLLLNVKTLQWMKEFLTFAEIPETMLPCLVPAGAVVGRLLPQVAESLGLPEVELVAAGSDQCCASLGLGGIYERLITANHGTGCFLVSPRTVPTFDPQQRFLCSPHAISGLWAIEAPMLATGGRQVKELMKLMRIASSVLEELEACTRPGSDGIFCVPHMGGATAPYWNRNARGAFCGLQSGHSKHDLLRSLLEGISFDMARNLEALGRPSEVRVAGGLARSDFFNQLQANVCDCPVVRGAETEATALGAAIIGAVTTGLHPDMASATGAMVRMDESSRKFPQREVRDTYLNLRPLHDRAVSLVHENFAQGGAYGCHLSV